MYFLFLLKQSRFCWFCLFVKGAFCNGSESAFIGKWSSFQKPSCKTKPFKSFLLNRKSWSAHLSGVGTWWFAVFPFFVRLEWQGFLKILPQVVRLLSGMRWWRDFVSPVFHGGSERWRSSCEKDEYLNSLEEKCKTKAHAQYIFPMLQTVYFFHCHLSIYVSPYCINNKLFFVYSVQV